MSQAPTVGLCANEPNGEEDVRGQDENVSTCRSGKALPSMYLNEDEHLHAHLHCRTDPVGIVATRNL